MEVAAGNGRVVVREEDRIVGDRAGFDGQRPRGVVSRSSDAPMTCGWQRKL